MKTRALLAIVLAGGLLGGCATSPDTAFAPAGAAAAPATADGPGDAAAPPAEKPDAVLKAALVKTHRATYKFTVSGDVPDKQRVKGSGSFDPKARKLSTTTRISGGKNPAARQRIVVGADLYEKAPSEGTWVHLDMKRIKKYDHLKVDMADPNGLAAFTAAIEPASVRRTGPNVFSGEFDPNPSEVDDFLPIGAPSIWVIGGTGNFSAATDARGYVTKINVVLTVKTTLKMTTTFTGHGKPVAVKKPKRTGEAYDFYYD